MRIADCPPTTAPWPSIAHSHDGHDLIAMGLARAVQIGTPSHPTEATWQIKRYRTTEQVPDGLGSSTDTLLKYVGLQRNSHRCTRKGCEFRPTQGKVQSVDTVYDKNPS